MESANVILLHCLGFLLQSSEPQKCKGVIRNIASTVDNGADDNHPVPINIDGKSHEDPDIGGISNTTVDPDINLKDTSCSHPGHIVMEEVIMDGC